MRTLPWRAPRPARNLQHVRWHGPTVPQNATIGDRWLNTRDGHEYTLTPDGWQRTSL